MDQMFTTTLIFYQKTKRMSPRGCCLKMWSLMQAALAPLYCLKKEQILWSQPRSDWIQNLWSGNQKPVFYQLSRWLLCMIEKQWCKALGTFCVLWRTICAWARRYKMGINSKNPIAKNDNFMKQNIKLLFVVYIWCWHIWKYNLI